MQEIERAADGAELGVGLVPAASAGHVAERADALGIDFPGGFQHGFRREDGVGLDPRAVSGALGAEPAVLAASAGLGVDDGTALKGRRELQPDFVREGDQVEQVRAVDFFRDGERGFAGDGLTVEDGISGADERVNGIVYGKAPELRR